MTRTATGSVLLFKTVAVEWVAGHRGRAGGAIWEATTGFRGDKRGWR